MTALKDMIPNATAAELELVATYAGLKNDGRRERAFSAFAETGLPHRRMEAWRWSDFKRALPSLEAPETGAASDPFTAIDGPVITFDGRGAHIPDTLPGGLRIFTKDGGEAFGAAEEMPLGAMTAALAGAGGGPSTVMIEVTGKVAIPLRIACAGKGAMALSRVTVLVRPGASLHVIESHLGGAGLSSHLADFGVQAGGALSRTIYQTGAGDEAQAITSDVHLSEGAAFHQTTLAFGARISRLETRVTHEESDATAVLNAAYLAGPGKHVDITTHVRHGAVNVVTKQVTKGAVLNGGQGIFQGKFLVPRHVGQGTDADMQHHALLLENGAVVNAKPELEIYADDVECAHGNTCGALDEGQLFYMRQRGIPEAKARALLTEAFVAEALDGADDAVADILRAAAADWLSAT